MRFLTLLLLIGCTSNGIKDDSYENWNHGCLEGGIAVIMMLVPQYTPDISTHQKICREIYIERLKFEDQQQVQ